MTEVNTNTVPEFPRVLLVEDNTANRDVMLHFIKKICTTDVASDAPSAIELAQSKQYHLILMDINLGLGMNGMEATKIIRKIDGYERVPIVAVTAYAMAGDKEIFMAAGCSHYISKPFTKKDFVALIEDILKESTSQE